MSLNNRGSNPALIGDAIKGKIASIIGWPVAIFFSLIIIAFFFAEGDENNTIAVIFCLIVLFIGILLIRYGKKNKNRIKRFKAYINIISSNNLRSIDQVAASISSPVDFVMRDIQKMILKNYFTNAFLDLNTHEIVFQKYADNVPNKTNTINTPTPPTPTTGEQVEMLVVSCTGCGATNQVAKNSIVECEYCGTAVTAR